MAKVGLHILLVILIVVVIGCHGVDSGASQLLPPTAKKQAKTAAFKTAGELAEADIVEKMAEARSSYREYLEALIRKYKETGNNMKLMWAKGELNKLDEVPQYNYIVEAGVPGPELKASSSIDLANYMYADAVRTEKKAGELIIVKNEDNLRWALEKYKEIISKHPTSDKIDDAAFRAGGICEYFKDYTIALLYYQRAYQWYPNTAHPTRFRAACILDKQMGRRLEALELYRQAVGKEKLTSNNKEFALKRIAELTKQNEKIQENK